MNLRNKKNNKGYVTEMKKVVIYFSIFVISFFCGIVFKHYFDEFSYYPGLRVIGYDDNGLLEYVDVIPNEKTALEVARAVWMPIYGRKNLVGYSYRIVLIEDRIWAIRGVNIVRKYFKVLGGGPFIEIDKKTGCVLQVGHTAACP